MQIYAYCQHDLHSARPDIRGGRRSVPPPVGRRRIEDHQGDGARFETNIPRDARQGRDLRRTESPWRWRSSDVLASQLSSRCEEGDAGPRTRSSTDCSAHEQAERPDEHRVLFLFLYDVCESLSGKDFADEQEEIESGRTGLYDYRQPGNGRSQSARISGLHALRTS